MGFHRCVGLSKRKCLAETKRNSGAGWVRGGGFRIVVRVSRANKRNLSGGRVSAILIQIGRVWVGFEGLGEGIQDLCLGL